MSSKPFSLAPPQTEALFPVVLPTGKWRRRFDTLRVKLFLAIAGANLVLVMAAYLIYSWSFDKGLTDYLNQAEEARLTPMVTRLAEGYRQHGEWSWISMDKSRWYTMLRETIGISGPTVVGTLARITAPDAASRPPLTFDWRMLLFDGSKNIIISSPGRTSDTQIKMRPIVVDNVTVGWNSVPLYYQITKAE